LLDFEPRLDLVTAVKELKEAYRTGKVPDSQSSVYRNVAWMKEQPDVWRTIAKQAS
jgi:hypothetical protein